MSSANMKENTKSVILVGRTGNGKSATGNTILGRSAFLSTFSKSAVTTTSELHSTKLDGQTLNVIDTPGLFDFSGDNKFTGREIVKCIKLANDGLHAILLVLSIPGKFSTEEAAGVEAMREFYGPKFFDYVIIIFTGGDALEDENRTLDDYLSDSNCPELLKDTLTKCGNRKLLFNNKSRDEANKSRQRRDLLSLVNNIVENNGGLPYTNQLFIEMKEVKQMREVYSKEEVSDLKAELQKLHDQQLTRVMDMIEAKYKLSLNVVNKQLAKEQADRVVAYDKHAKQLQDETLARLKAELQTAAKIAAEKETNEKLCEMEEELRKLQSEAADRAKKTCTIL